MTNIVYDSIGRSYIRTRHADPRIVHALLAALSSPPGTRIIDIGAGTGNYASELVAYGLKIVALEPSPVMRAQRQPKKSLDWIAGRAEAIPLATKQVDAALCMLSVHHFTHRVEAFREMHRVLRDGPIVLLTFDPRLSAPFWFTEYFPTIWQDSYRVFPPLDELMAELADHTGRHVNSRPFCLPPGLVDGVAAAGWQRPSIYLDPQVRAGMSAFALADQQAVNRGVAALERDLQSGQWYHANGALLAQESFDAGYRLVVASN